MSKSGAPFGYDNHYDPDRNKALKKIFTEKPETIHAYTGPWAYIKHKAAYIKHKAQYFWLWLSSKIWKRGLLTTGNGANISFPPEIEAAFEKAEASRRASTLIHQNDEIIKNLQDIAKSLREVSAHMRAVNESPAFDTELSDKLAASEAYRRKP